MDLNEIYTLLWKTATFRAEPARVGERKTGQGTTPKTGFGVVRV